MRIRRSVPQKPLTEEQKQRALEAQKRFTQTQTQIPQYQMYQSQQSPISSTGSRYPFNSMDRSFMMNKKMSFEEKYGVYNNPQKETVVEFKETPVVDNEDFVVPPSLEEDPNQASPLPPGVHNVSEEDDLDAYIKQAEELKKATEEENPIQEDAIDMSVLEKDEGLGAMDIMILEETLSALSVKELKQEYVNRGGTRDISHNNNKKNIINLILELIANGTQQEEEGSTNG